MRSFHAGFERLEIFGHLRVVCRADIEEEVFKLLTTLAGRLSHRRGGITQDDPAGFGHANLHMHRLPPVLLIEIHAITGDIGELTGIRGTTHADVRIHFGHHGRFKLPRQFHAVFGRATVQTSQDGIVLDVHDGNRTDATGFIDQSADQIRFRQVKRFDQNFLAGLQAATVVNEHICEFVNARILHGCPGLSGRFKSDCCDVVGV